MTRKITISQKSVEALPITGKQVDYWDSKLTGFGVRVSPGGTKSYFYTGRLDGRQVRCSIGKNQIFKAEAARRKALEYAGQLASGIDPRKKRAEGVSFGVLLEEYIDYCRRRGVVSTKQIENTLRRNIEKGYPSIWNKPVLSISDDDCMKVIRKLTSKEKLRTADRVRSYIKSAFTYAINSKSNTLASQSVQDIGVTVNPVAQMKKIVGSSNPKQNALSASELKTYFKHVSQLPEPTKSLMTLHLLTGGQRQSMLQRVLIDDIDMDAQVMTLYDRKGQRHKPEIHIVPLLDSAVECIKKITAGPYIFSCDGGITPVNTDYFNSNAKKIFEKMFPEDQMGKGKYSAGIIRSTVETRLLAKPYHVSSDILASLLSHGRGGVQQKHYQHYDFYDEKLQALHMLERMVNG